MKENRYEIADVHYLSNSAIFDTKTNNILVLYQLCDLLNQQDKLIKELEEELDDAKRDYIPKLEFGLQRANKMGRDAEKENHQLKQKLDYTEESYNRTMAYLNIIRSELLNLPNKIVEEIKKELYLEDGPYIEICIVKGILNRILKKYEGEYEN